MNWPDKLADWGWQALLAIATAALGWFFYIERKIAAMASKNTRENGELRLHVAENYVKKSDIQELKQEIAADFKELKDGISYIIDLQMKQKIGTTRRK